MRYRIFPPKVRMFNLITSFQYCTWVCAYVLSCSVMSDSLDYRMLGSYVHRISQARILEWVAISFSRGSSHFRGQTQASCASFTGRQILLLLLLFIFYYSGFCHTLKWNSHGFTCVPHPDPPSHLPLHPIPLGLLSAPGPSACLIHPTWAGDLFHTR